MVSGAWRGILSLRAESLSRAPRPASRATHHAPRITRHAQRQSSTTTSSCASPSSAGTYAAMFRARETASHSGPLFCSRK